MDTIYARNLNSENGRRQTASQIQNEVPFPRSQLRKCFVFPKEFEEPGCYGCLMNKGRITVVIEKHIIPENKNVITGF
ncbi:MAG: hypothetical protein QW478_15550 [Candidatus Micrarchaeaceae archaeon]